MTTAVGCCPETDSDSPNAARPLPQDKTEYTATKPNAETSVALGTPLCRGDRGVAVLTLNAGEYTARPCAGAARLPFLPAKHVFGVLNE